MLYTIIIISLVDIINLFLLYIVSFPVKKLFSYYVRRLLREWEPRVMAV